MTIDLDAPRSISPTVVRTPEPVRDLDVVSHGNTLFLLVPTLPPVLLEKAWDLYIETFEELRTAAAQRHVMFRSEFDEVMSDTRITKILGFDGPRLCALAVETNDLHAVPLISPEFYEARYPAQYAAKAIVYVGFYAVGRNYQRSGVLIDLMRAIAAPVPPGAIVAMDISSSRRARHMDKAVGRIVRSIDPGAQTVCLDEQSFWAYEFSPEE
jgi:hypothetical protein